MTAERFEVVVNLIDLRQARRLRVRVQVPGDDPSVPSLFEVGKAVLEELGTRK